VTTQFSVYLRNQEGAWEYWRSSSWFQPSEEWAPATWFLPTIPEEATGISFGLAIFDDGTLTTDDYRLYDISAVEVGGGGQE
jgi:hypothetical protein